MNSFEVRQRAIEDAHRAFVDGAAATQARPFTREKCAEAILLAVIALVHLEKVDHESRAKDLAIEAIHDERRRRGWAEGAER